MTPEKREFPDRAQQERQHDLEWIGENLPIFWTAAKNSFKTMGRGAIVVDTTSQPTGEGNPFSYYPQEIVEKGEEEDIKRMVKGYDPEKELVIVLLKKEKRRSTYRLQPKIRN